MQVQQIPDQRDSPGSYVLPGTVSASRGLPRTARPLRIRYSK
jgi:hypothetical protein